MLTDMSTAEVTKQGLCDLQVCVPKDCMDTEAEEFANSQCPTGIASEWRMKKNGDPTLNGDPERVKCLGRAGHVHIMLQC